MSLRRTDVRESHGRGGRLHASRIEHRCERAGLVLAFAGDAPDKVAASVTAALGDADPGVRAAGLEALAALRAARADDRKLREALENAGAETALGDAAADYGEWIRGA